jgi:3-deoxy-D-manno-octulosonic-acid transferase
MLLYNLVVRSYALAIRLASFKQEKAKQWVEGRKNWRSKLALKIRELGPATGNIWIHCASYGEFEQGRPLMEAIRNSHPGKKIILSFFSPSGYEAFSDWKGADVVCYLPLDTKSNAKDFIAIVNPKAAIFIKYEFWLNFLEVLQKRNVPTYLVSAVFKPHHPFFKWYGKLFRRSLSTFSRLFVQDANSAKLLTGIGINNHEVTGDTRFDRVLQIRDTKVDFAAVEQFRGSSKLIIAGSTWPKDEELIISAFTKLGGDLKLLIAPHNIGEPFIAKLSAALESAGLSHCLYSTGNTAGARVMVLDTMGMLSGVYRYGDCAYVGGGFNGGIHNTLEPAVYGIPVMFSGSDFHKYNEAVELLEMGAARNVTDTGSLIAAVNEFLFNDDERKLIRARLSEYFSERSNSTGRILALMKL